MEEKVVLVAGPETDDSSNAVIVDTGPEATRKHGRRNEQVRRLVQNTIVVGVDRYGERFVQRRRFADRAEHQLTHRFDWLGLAQSRDARLDEPIAIKSSHRHSLLRQA